MSKHTPGPWIVQPDPAWAGKHPYHDHRFITSGPDKFNDDAWLEHRDNVIICSMRDSENQAANAKLIAAAPDLLEALKTIFGCVCEQGENYYPKGTACYDAIEAARAAIAKAEGRQL